jgi:hypothetical protein
MDNNADTALIISIVAAAVAGIGLIVSIASATYTRRQAAAAERSAAADEIAARAADAERRAREEAGSAAAVPDDRRLRRGNVAWRGRRSPRPARVPGPIAGGRG